MFFCFKDPINVLLRFTFAMGRYPCTIRLKTPIGTRNVIASSFHDVRSLVVCFAKEDYPASNNIRCAVDFGSNVGMSALYFLTRNSDVRAYLFEPLPQNVERLTENLKGLEDRYVLQSCAIGLNDGVAKFVYEPSGRYGGVEEKLDTHEHVDRPFTMEVETREANALLRQIIEKETFIDVLKVNIEGYEDDVLRNLPADIVERIGFICAEVFDFTGELNGFNKQKYGTNITWFVKQAEAS
jgi:FkbM family methyltransferase